MVLTMCLGLLLVWGFQALDTVHKEFILLRAEANEDASTIDLTSEGDFASKPASAVQLIARTDGTGHGGNAMELIFCGGDTANDTFGYKIYAWRCTNGPARMAATGIGTLGTQAVVKYPHSGSTATNIYWADTLTVTHRWLRTVTSTDTSGNNETASIVLDMSGYEFFHVEITNADGTSTKAESVSVYYSYF